MDMKRILQAFDGASTKPVEGSNDMKKFLQVVTEGANPHKVSLPVQMAMQQYQAPKEPVAVKEPSLLKKYFAEAEVEVAEQLAEEEATRRQRINMYAQKIADRVLMRESQVNEGGVTLGGGGFTMDDQIALNQRMQAQASGATAGGVPIGSTPPGINRLTGKPIEPAAPAAPATPAPAAAPAGPRGTNLKMAVLQQMKAGTYKGFGPKLSPEEIDAAIAYKQQAGDLQESPIAMDPAEPNNPTIHGHEKANSMTLKGRITSARAQLQELAQLAESNDLATWQRICQLAKGGMFMGLEQNLEQVRHGIEQLAAKRKQGGVNSRGIDKNISERSVSQAQAHLMAAAAHNPEFAKKVKMKQSVAKEFNKADKAKNIKSLPTRVPKKK